MFILMEDNATGTQSSTSSSNVVFVGSLPWETTDVELKALFEDKGLQIAEDETKEDGYVKKAVVVVKDRETGRSKGYGFVNLISAEEATKAIQMLDGYEIGSDDNKRNITVKEKEDRPPRSGGNRFGGDRRSSGGGSRYGGGDNRRNGGGNRFGGGDRRGGYNQDNA